MAVLSGATFITNSQGFNLAGNASPFTGKSFEFTMLFSLRLNKEKPIVAKDPYDGL